MVTSVTKEHMGVYNRPKKCHVIFEWPLKKKKQKESEREKRERESKNLPIDKHDKHFKVSAQT
jgi:hypothetical protein